MSAKLLESVNCGTFFHVVGPKSERVALFLIADSKAVVVSVHFSVWIDEVYSKFPSVFYCQRVKEFQSVPKRSVTFF